MLKTFPPTRLLLVRTLHSLLRVPTSVKPALQTRLLSSTAQRHATKTVAPTDVSSRSNVAKSTGFESLGLLPALIDALREENIQQATDVQLKSIPAILNGSDVLMAAQTGTGKTLAYLLPIIHRLKQEEAAGFTPRPGRPRVLLLAPTRELAQQVGRVSKLLSYHAVFRSVCLSVEDSSKAMQKVQLKTKLLDVVIATPARLQYHIIQGNISMSDVHTVVMDEADTLFDHSFSEMTEKLVNSIQSRMSKAKKARDDAQALDSQIAAKSTDTKVATESDDELGADFDPSQIGLNASSIGSVTGDPSHSLLNSKGSVPAALRHIVDQHCQFVLVSATMPASLVKKLRRLLPNLVSVSTSVVHRPPSKLKQNFILVGNQNKIELLVSALKQESIAYGADNASPQTAAVEAATSFPFAPATERVKKSKQDSIKHDSIKPDSIKPDSTHTDEQRVNPHSNRVVMTQLTEDDVRGAQAELHQKSMEHVDSSSAVGATSSSAPAEFITDYAAHAAANPDATQVDGVMFHVPATIVFCNTVPACRAVEIALCEAGFAAVGYHGAVPSHSRAQNWRRFCAGSRSLLVTTDLAARGLDTTHVHHVVLFDFPQTPVDYLHRVGRTARAGNEGKLTALVTKSDRPLAEAIQKSNDRGESLELADEAWVPGQSTSTDRASAGGSGARSSFLSKFYANKDARSSPKSYERPARDSDRSGYRGDRDDRSGRFYFNLTPRRDRRAGDGSDGSDGERGVGRRHDGFDRSPRSSGAGQDRSRPSSSRSRDGEFRGRSGSRDGSGAYRSDRDSRLTRRDFDGPRSAVRRPL